MHGLVPMRALSDEATRRLAGWVGAIIFGAATVMELVRMFVLRISWPGLDENVDVVMTVLAIAFWVPSAVVLAKRTRKLRLIAFIGAFVLLSHGLLGTIARSTSGVIYVVLGLMIPVVERLAFGGKLGLGSATAPPPRPNAGPPEVY